MSADLVRRLRDRDHVGTPTTERNLITSAADRIEELEAKLAKAVEALKHAEKYGDVETSAWAYDTLAELKGTDT